MRTSQLLVKAQGGCSPHDPSSRISHGKSVDTFRLEKFSDSRYEGQIWYICETEDCRTWQPSEPKEERTRENKRQSFGIYINIKHTLSYMIPSPHKLMPNKLPYDERHLNSEPLALTKNNLQKLLKPNGNKSVTIRIQAIVSLQNLKIQPFENLGQSFDSDHTLNKHVESNLTITYPLAHRSGSAGSSPS